MWDPLWSGIEPESPAFAGRFFTSEPPGKPLNVLSFCQCSKGVCSLPASARGHRDRVWERCACLGGVLTWPGGGHGWCAYTQLHDSGICWHYTWHHGKRWWAVMPDLNLRPVSLDRGPFWGQQHAKPCLKEKKRHSLSSLGKIWLLSCPPKLCFLPLWLWCLVSHVWFFATSWTVACQALLSLGFSRQEYWSGLSFPPPSVSLHAWRKID